MKFIGLVPLDLLLVVAASIHYGDAAKFLGPRQASLVDKAQSLEHEKKKDMPVTKHSKVAGGEYQKGSPLYEKQEERKAGGDVKTVEHAEKLDEDGDRTLVTVSKPPLEKDPEKWNADKAWKDYGGWKAHWRYSFWSFLSFFIVTMLAGLVWDKRAGGRSKRGWDRKKNTPPDFAYGLFSTEQCCNQDSCCSVFLCSCFCAPVRIADTYAKEPLPLFRSFWGALVIVTLLLSLDHLTMGITGLIFTLFAIYFRQQLRKQYGLSTGGMSVLADCCAWCLCPFCSMAQEARQVEFVKKPGDMGPAMSKPGTFNDSMSVPDSMSMPTSQGMGTPQNRRMN